MQLALQFVAVVIGLALGLLILSAMLRGPWRQYPFLFLYVAGDLMTTLLEIQPALRYDSASAAERKQFALLYWLDERAMQILVFLLVISLIYRASAHLKARNVLIAGAVCGI